MSPLCEALIALNLTFGVVCQPAATGKSSPLPENDKAVWQYKPTAPVAAHVAPAFPAVIIRQEASLPIAVPEPAPVTAQLTPPALPAPPDFYRLALEAALSTPGVPPAPFGVEGLASGGGSPEPMPRLAPPERGPLDLPPPNSQKRYDSQGRKSSLPVDNARILTADRYISGILETGLNSQLGSAAGGSVIIQTSRDVFGYHGRNILVPKGSRLICGYDSPGRQGETRIAFSCTRILMAGHRAEILQLSAAVGDVQGRGGVTGQVDFKGRKIGQIVLVGIEKDGRREALPADAYTTQFDLTTPELNPANEVVIEGDGAAMVAALVRLSETPPEAPQEQSLTTDDAKSAQPQNGGGGRENGQAASYKTPDPVTVSPEAVEAVRVTTAGCPIRIDLGQLRAIQQSKTETTKAGTLVSESACSDSAEGFDLQKSYTVCSDTVDLTARTATAQYVLFYVDGGGSRQEVTDCASDAEKIFPIIEKFDACTIYLDYSGLKAVPQSTLIYQNDNNAEVQVRGCQASQTKQAVAMISTTNGCSIRHEFALSKSFQQGTNTYLMDGIQYTAGGCMDDGTEYVHATTFLDTVGGSVCTPIVDLAGGDVTLQSRIRITVNGAPQFITECSPDTSGQLALIATTDGCTNVASWQHDLTAGQSYGQERHYYTYNGKQNFVNSCQTSQAVYAHQVETTGWQNHDDQLFAYALDTIYIDAPTGRYDIQVSQVQSGAIQMPFQLNGTAISPTGAATYSACDKYLETETVEQWLRPDATTFEKPIGAAAPLGPSDACTRTVSTTWNLVSSRVTSSTTVIYAATHNNKTRYGTYGGSYQATREDGVVIISDSDAREISCGTSAWIKNPPVATAPVCSSTITGITVSGWNTENGWLAF